MAKKSSLIARMLIYKIWDFNARLTTELKLVSNYKGWGYAFTDGNKDGSVCGRNFAALKRFINSWLTLSSR